MSRCLLNKIQILNHVDTLLAIAQKTNLGSSITEQGKTLRSDMRSCELVIPVVGAFSTGKSTMLNTLLGENILPTAIKPETCLATELRYADQSCLEAVGVDGQISRHEVEYIKGIEEQASSIAFLRLFLNNRHLKDIEPLVLVDMPGFDAPLENHNKAIMNYLLRGCHFFVLCDAQSGTISRTLMSRLHEIEEFDRGINLFLSKTDLKPHEEVKKILDHINNQLQEEFLENIPLAPIDNTSVEAVRKSVASLDSNALFCRIFIPELVKLCNEMLDTVNLKLKAVQKSRQQLDNVLDELKAGLDKLKAKAEADTEYIRKTCSAGLTNDVIDAVGRDLSLAKGELVNILANGNQTEAEHRLNEIVRCSLHAAIRDKLGEVNENICREFSTSLAGIDRILKEEQIDDAFIEKLSQKIQQAFMDLQATLRNQNTLATCSRLLSMSGKTAALGMGAKVMGGSVLATGLLGSTSIAMPIIGVVLMFLPEILGGFFKNANRERVHAALRSKLEGEIFPAIRRKLRESLPQQLDAQVASMIDAVHKEYDALIKDKMNTIQETAANQNNTRQEQEQQSQALEDARNQITVILNPLLNS